MENSQILGRQCTARRWRERERERERRHELRRPVSSVCRPCYSKPLHPPPPPLSLSLSLCPWCWWCSCHTCHALVQEQSRATRCLRYKRPLLRRPAVPCSATATVTLHTRPPIPPSSYLPAYLPPERLDSTLL